MPFFCNKESSDKYVPVFCTFGLGACPILTFLLRRTSCNHLHRSRPKKSSMYSSEYTSGFFGPAALLLVAPPSRRQCRTGSYRLANHWRGSIGSAPSRNSKYRVFSPVMPVSPVSPIACPAPTSAPTVVSIFDAWAYNEKNPFA